MASLLLRMSSIHDHESIASMHTCRGSSIDDTSSTSLQFRDHHCRQHSGPVFRISNRLADDALAYWYTKHSAADPPGHFSRRTKSESHVPHRSNEPVDDSFLANLAAIQLLSGCMTIPSKHILSESHHSVNFLSGAKQRLPDLTLPMVSTLSVTVYHDRNSLNPPSRSLSSSLDFRPTLTSGIDGHSSFPSDESVSQGIKTRSAPIPPSSLSGSEELNNRLRAIDEALLQDKGHSQKRQRRLHAWEVSRRECSQAVDDDSSGADQLGEHVVDVLHAWRNSQHRDLSQLSGVLFPSPEPSEAFSSGQPPPNRSALKDRSNLTIEQSLRDRISRRLHARSRSSRCDMSYDPMASRHRRRSARYSSVCMSSAESSPLCNTPVSCIGSISSSQVRADPRHSAVNPLAAVSLLLATTELDRLATRIEESSEMHLGSHSTAETPNAGKCCGHCVAPNTPTIRGLASRETWTGATSTNLTSETETPRSICQAPTEPLNTPVSNIDTISDGTTSALGLFALNKHRRQKTSSRRSEIFSPEGIAEGFGEDMSSSASNSAQDSSAAGPSNSTEPMTTLSDVHVDPVKHAFEQVRLNQDKSPKSFEGNAKTRRSKTPGLRIEFANPLAAREGTTLD